MAENILKHPQFNEIATALENDRGLPPGSLKAVMMQESGGNPNALSNKGARGAFQFIPSTAKAYNVDTSNPWDSMRGAADYLGDNMKKYGRFDAALADYNGGPTQAQSVLKAGKPTYPETQNYVTRIMGKIGDAIIPSANAEEAPPRQQAPALRPASPIDPKDIQAAGFKVTRAKQQGVSDEAIIDGLIKTAPPHIAQAVKRNVEDGVPVDKIISGIGGKPFADWQKDIKDANPTNGMSTTQKVLAGAGKSFSDVGTGVKQLATRVFGSDEAVRAQQAAVAEEEKAAAPLMDTTAGKVGYVGGVLAPTIATMGAGGAVTALSRFPQAAKAFQAVNAVGRTPVVNAAVNAAGGVLAPSSVRGMVASGAIQGAVTPTTNDSDGINNVVYGGAVAGAAGGLLNKLARPLGNQAADAAPALIQKADQFGLPVSAANIAQEAAPSSFAGRLAQRITNPTEAQIAAVDTAIARNVGEGVGIKGATSIDNELVRAAKGKPYAEFNALTDGVQIPISGARLRADLAGALGKYSQSLDTQSPAVADAIGDLIKRTAPLKNGVNPSFSPEFIISKQRTLGKLASEVDGVDREVVNAARNSLDTQLTARMSAEQNAAHSLAKEQHKNFEALKEVVDKTGDLGSVTPSQLVQSIKNASLGDNFASGNAAYQDLATTLTKLYGKKGVAPKPTNEFGLRMSDAMFGIPLGLSSGLASGLAVPAVRLAGGAVLRKALDSQTPAVRNMVLGNTDLQNKLVKLKGPALAAALARIQVTQNNN